MAGTPEGGRKAAAAILKNNPNHFKTIGAKGGAIGSTGGFAHMAIHNPERLKQLSAKGGKAKAK